MAIELFKEESSMEELLTENGINPINTNNNTISFETFYKIISIVKKFNSSKLKSIVELVKDVRTTQKEYFKNRSMDVLKYCRTKEIELDKKIKELEEEIK